MFDKSIYRALDELEDGVIITDKEGFVQFLNMKAASLDQIIREHAISRHLLDVYPSLCDKTSTLLQVIKNKACIEEQIQSYKNYKGEELTTINSSYPIYDGSNFIGVMGISKDVTKVESQEVLQLKKQLFRDPAEKKIIRNIGKYDFIDIIGKSEILLNVKKKAAMASKTTSPILVYGETGTGKELFVHAIHNNSNRRERPFVVQNCATIPATLLEGILFGTAKGSFTGAEDRKGIFEIASNGTLYLDELNSMPIELQGKLLRTLQDGTIRRVGCTEVRKVDVRIIASLNETPEQCVQENKIRKDLYYRLNVVRINIPTLRERKEDISLLVEFFIGKMNKKFNSHIKGIRSEALQLLLLQEWRGNVRELEHLIEAVFNNKRQGTILKSDIEEVMEVQYIRKEISLKDKMVEMEIKYINEAMLLSQGNISLAAKRLGIPRQTLQYKLKKMNR